MDKYIVCFDKTTADILSNSYDLLFKIENMYYFENKPVDNFDKAFFDGLNVVTTNILTMTF